MADIDRNIFAEILNLVHSGYQFTDLLIHEEQPVMATTPEGLRAVEDFAPPTRDELEKAFEKLEPQWEGVLETGMAIDRAYDLTDWRLRVNASGAGGGSMLVIIVRRIPIQPLSLADIGLAQKIPIMIGGGKGLVIVCGPMSSGKTTTLAGTVDYINSTQAKHILTIEDPIEYVHKRKKSVITQREIPTDAISFAQAVKTGLRQKVNVMLIGEIRDRDTAEQVVLASESSVLVLCTLHANSPAGAIQKLLSFFTEDEQPSILLSLQKNLLGVISQLLLSTKDRKGWVLASELLFNQQRQIMDKIGTYDAIVRHMESGEDKLNRTMHDALVELANSGVISIVDAIQSISGPEQDKLSATLEGQ